MHIKMPKTGALLLIGLVSVNIVALCAVVTTGRNEKNQDSVSVRVIEHAVAATEAVQHKPETYLPVVNQPDIRNKDKQLLNDVLMWLPSSCRENLDNLVVRYDPEAPRGQSTSSTILIRGGMSSAETVAVMIHECGHIVDLGNFTGTYEAGESVYPDGPIATFNDDLSVNFYAISWRNIVSHRNYAADEDFVSGYAASDPFEDFAESFILFALHNKLFLEMAMTNTIIAQKYNFMNSVVFGDDFEPMSGSSNQSHTRRTWDITKLAHKLI